MSADLEDLLRRAAEGPSPALDTAALRRAGVRRRRRARVAAGAGVAGLIAVAGIGVAGVIPDPDPRPSVADRPESSGAPEVEDASPGEVGSVGAPVTLTVEPDGDRCLLRVTADGEAGQLSSRLWLPPSTSQRSGEELSLCASELDERDLDEIELPIARAPALDDTLHPEQLLVGLVWSDVEAIRIRTDLADVTVRTEPVETPGAVELRSYAVLVPVADADDEPQDRRVTHYDTDGPLGAEMRPTQALFDLAWSAADDAEPGFGTTGQPIDDLPLGLPDDVPPLGAWRPAPSPVDLSPLSMRDTSDTWFANEDPHVPSYPVERQVVIDRLGTPERFDELCTFLDNEFERANVEVDTSGEPAEIVAQALVHLVLRQEQVQAGDAATATVAHTCGLPSTFEDR